MQEIKTVYLVIYVFFILLGIETAHADGVTGLVDRLTQSTAINIDAIVEKQVGTVDTGNGFTVADPYGSEVSSIILRQQSAPGHETRVCALRFADADQNDYELKTFETPTAAVEAGFTITHHGSCGTCSTLRDLAVYLAKPDLTTPARQCARRFGLARKKQCFEEKLGFTSYCAESWAYNAQHTKKACKGTCIADYGFFNLLFHRYPGENTDASGALRPCLKCDEEESGPGFKYSAGRTRRNSGITSAIQRPEAEIFRVDHSAYFRY